MEDCPVVIIGAGPSGLALGIRLAQLGVQSTIIEKQPNITEDPRAIVLMGDSVRIAGNLGIANELLSTIGHTIKSMNYHHGNLSTQAFMPMDLTHDFLNQWYPGSVGHFQPLLERSLRDRIQETSLCSIRSGCEVTHIEESPESPIVTFKDQAEELRKIRCAWLVGADGKRGILRKRYLEKHGVRQQLGLFQYEGTWVATNFEITMPTPETHPEFPLWKVGVTPEEVAREFWPEGFHFLSDPKRPSVSGRFGPLSKRYWRHEFEVEESDDTEHCETLFWDQFTQNIQRPAQHFSSELGDQIIEFPRNCLKIMRCQPFKFSALVANKWFHDRMILVGDAAHVFPPFGGQGIASGFRDVDCLAWRLALFQRTNMPLSICQNLLRGWNSERRNGVDQSLLLTARNGDIANEKSVFKANLREMIMGLLYRFEWTGNLATSMWHQGQNTIGSCNDQFFLSEMNGGIKMAQVWLVQGQGPPLLSDQIFPSKETLFHLLVIEDSKSSVQTAADILSLIEDAKLPNDLLSSKSLIRVSKDLSSEQRYEGIWSVCTTPMLEQMGKKPPRGYSPNAFFTRPGNNKRYIIVRPDMYTYCAVLSLADLKSALSKLRDMLA